MTSDSFAWPTASSEGWERDGAERVVRFGGEAGVHGARQYPPRHHRRQVRARGPPRLSCPTPRRFGFGDWFLFPPSSPLLSGELNQNGRDEERSYQAHIAGSHHFASGSFEARMPELARAASGKDTLVFHCALSQVPDPPPSLLSITLPRSLYLGIWFPRQKMRKMLTASRLDWFTFAQFSGSQPLMKYYCLMIDEPQWYRGSSGKTNNLHETLCWHVHQTK